MGPLDRLSMHLEQVIFGLLASDTRPMSQCGLNVDRYAIAQLGGYSAGRPAPAHCQISAPICQTRHSALVTPKPRTGIN